MAAQCAIQRPTPNEEGLPHVLTTTARYSVNGIPAGCAQYSKAVRTFEAYVRKNRAFLPNYGERYRQGKIISRAFVESAVNQVVSKRFVKKQQMRWTATGAHLLLQIRIEVLNGGWRSTVPKLTRRLKQPPPMMTA
jgi:hypothetical protein